MRPRRSRSEHGVTTEKHKVGLDPAHGRVLLGLLVLALVPALVGVSLATFLAPQPNTATASEHARLTSAVAADVLVRSQGIEARLAALAADADLAGLSPTINSSNRPLARRSFSSLRGSDGAIVAGACVTRVSDGRMTVIAEDRDVVSPYATCATGDVLALASRATAGRVVRSQATGGQHLLIATPIAGRGKTATVLAAVVDLETLLERIPMPAASPSTVMIVDLESTDLVAGAARPGTAGQDAAQPLQPRDLAAYSMGILSGYAATETALARAGWDTTVADLWPADSGSGLGLIAAWPAVQPPSNSGTWFVLVSVALVALLGVLVLMRLLIKPFRELRESQSQLESLYREAREDSLHDGLTGMGNHRAFQDELTHQVELSERDGTPFVLMLIDLDNLKVVNDREGHAEGDRLLTGLATAMREALRPADRFFRIGGDEFAVLMPATEPEAAMEAAGRLRHYCLRPPARERPTPFSGGISAMPRFALEASQVQRQADVALYWAKRHGRGFVEVFDADRDRLPDENGPAGLGNLVYEMARGRMFTPVYQPIVNLRTGAVIGFEGLVRPDPDSPITDSEQLFRAAAATGRTVELDLASFETVCKGAKAIGPDHVISINLSAKTLEVKDFDSGWLLNTLQRFGISPARVILELTERDPIIDVPRLKNNVSHLGEYGLRLAADDVGAGSAGLRMLAEIPFDIVKIDLSLVQSGAQHAASWAVLRSIRDLAWRQRSVVIGEGVETPEQLGALQQLGIPVGQGYLLGRPGALPDSRPRDLANLVVDQERGHSAPPVSHDDVQDLPDLPELVIDQPIPRPMPLQLTAMPAGQA